MKPENAATYFNNMLVAPQMSDYLTKALTTGMEQNKLLLMRTSIEPSKMDYDPDRVMDRYSSMKVMFKLDQIQRHLELLVFNLDDLRALDDDSTVFWTAYGWHGESDNALRAAEPKDQWVYNYKPGMTADEDYQQVFLDSHPEMVTYELARLLLDLAGLPLEHLHLVHIDNVGLRHVISMPNENDNDPDMTYVLLEPQPRSAYNRWGRDYRLNSGNSGESRILHALLHEILPFGDEPYTEPHPLSTEDHEVEWAIFGPYHVCYRQKTMFVYTGEHDSDVPAQALIEVLPAPLYPHVPGALTYRMNEREDVLTLLSSVPALYQESMGSNLARDILVSSMANDMRTITLQVQVDEHGVPVLIRLRQGDVLMQFNLQY